METPSSTRRVTRSQTKSSSKILTEDSNPRPKPAAIQERGALIDITNDSPIVGVASGALGTPHSSSVTKQRRYKATPNSGEALLRGQVKTLLQKVEEEGEDLSTKFSFGGGGPLRDNLKAFLNSPAGLLAPTPANTPQVLNFSSSSTAAAAFGDLEPFGSSFCHSVIEDQLNISQVMNGIFDVNKQTDSSSESDRDLISRTLFLEFSEKSDSSSECSSVVTFQGTGTAQKGSQEKSALTEDDDASIWSIQVNVSTRDEEEDDEEVVQDEASVFDDDDADYGEEGEEYEDDSLLDELCEGISNISVNGEKRFNGKHTRFVYNSDDELVDEQADNVLRLKGLPTPKGKHLRFQEEGDEE